MKNGTLNEAEVIALLKRKQGKMSQLDFSTLMKISKQYLNDIYAGRRSPGPAVLEYLKLEKVFRPIVRVHRKKAVAA